jgi:hypothetical protein
MEMALHVAAMLACVLAAFNAPFARAVVFGVHIDGNPSLIAMRSCVVPRGLPV